MPLLDLTGRTDLIKLPQDIGERAPQLMQLTLAGPQSSTSTVGPIVGIVRRWGIHPLMHRFTPLHPFYGHTVSENLFEGHSMCPMPDHLHQQESMHREVCPLRPVRRRTC